MNEVFVRTITKKRNFDEDNRRDKNRKFSNLSNIYIRSLNISYKTQKKRTYEYRFGQFLNVKRKKKNLSSDTSMRTLSTRSKTKNLRKKIVSKKEYISIRIIFFFLS